MSGQMKSITCVRPLRRPIGEPGQQTARTGIYLFGYLAGPKNITRNADRASRARNAIGGFVR